MARENGNKREDCQFLNMVLDSSFGNIFVTDGEGNIIYANETVAKSMELPVDKLTTMSVYDLVEQHIVSYKPASITVLETKRKTIQSVKTPDGSNLVLSAEPMFDDDGNITYIVVFSQKKDVVQEFMKVLQDQNNLMSQTLSHVLNNPTNNNDIIAESPIMKSCLEIAKRASATDSNILLYGESGSGKEVVAGYIHQKSGRSQKIFLPVNCAAIPHELMESELFGYEKGAFTGSGKSGKLGLFELADGGTLFMDEIGELDLSMQSKLLRVLESGEIMHVGGTKIKKVDVRIITATNRDLEKMVRERRFREDLFYRMSVIPIMVPPIRQRREDISALANFFINNLNHKYSMNKMFSKDALQALEEYDWPGNVREIRNVVERIFAIVPDSVISKYHVQEVLGQGWRKYNDEDVLSRKQDMDTQINMLSANPENTNLHDATEMFQRQYIENALNQCGGHVEQTAAMIGIGRSGLYKKMERLGIK